MPRKSLSIKGGLKKNKKVLLAVGIILLIALVVCLILFFTGVFDTSDSDTNPVSVPAATAEPIDFEAEGGAVVITEAVPEGEETDPQNDSLIVYSALTEEFQDVNSFEPANYDGIKICNWIFKNPQWPEAEFSYEEYYEAIKAYATAVKGATTSATAEADAWTTLLNSPAVNIYNDLTNGMTDDVINAVKEFFLTLGNYGNSIDAEESLTSTSAGAPQDADQAGNVPPSSGILL